MALLKQNWAALPYNTRRINSHYLVSNFLGCWDILNREEYRRLNAFGINEGDALFNRLLDRGIILKEDNLPRLIDDFRRLNSHLFNDAGLHIAVLTTRCSLDCRYCQTRTAEPMDMDLQVASRVLKYLFDVRNPNVTLELQGGEPLLNWDVARELITSARRINTNKSLYISLVTNGTLLDEEKIRFLLGHDVSICVSLDGPAEVHNKNRVFKDGQGSYAQAIAAIKRLKKIYKEKKIQKKTDLLPTVTRYSLNAYKKIIDEYVSLGAGQIALRPVNRIGIASEHWDNIGYSPDEFNRFWARSMDYILELNKKGVHIQERMARVFLKKIIKKEDPGYVDMMSPCGAGRAVLAYMPNGDVYPCDEARMAGSDIFKLGNVMTDEYEGLIKGTNLFPVCQASLNELADYNNAYMPWCGTCPVLNYITSGNLIGRVASNPLHKIHDFQLEYLFRKMAEDENIKSIFNQWVE